MAYQPQMNARNQDASSAIPRCRQEYVSGPGPHNYCYLTSTWNQDINIATDRKKVSSYLPYISINLESTCNVEYLLTLGKTHSIHSFRIYNENGSIIGTSIFKI